MSNELILLIAAVVPIVVLTFFRINAVMVFLSLCLGEVMVHYIAGSANSMLTWMAPNMTPVSASMVQLGVLLLPVVLISVSMLFSVHGRMRTLLNILPAAGVGVLGVLLVVPLLPPGLKFGLEEQALWQQLVRLQSLVVGASALISLFFLWSQRRTMGHHAEK